MTPSLPSRADVVIVGGGIIGLSLAYHLARNGVKDVLLLERKQLTCGTTWHAAGLVTQLRATENMARLAQYTAQLFVELERETGQATGFRQCGSVTVATTRERLIELKRGASMGRSFGLDVQIIDGAAAQSLAPLLNVSDVLGAAYIPSDGKTNPVDTARAFAIGARARGARIVENVRVSGFVIDAGTIRGVRTEFGDVKCDAVALCGGMWSRELGAMTGTPIPLHAAEHFYVITEAMSGLRPDFPVVRDLDGCFYAKEDAGKLLVGAFEPNGKPWGMQGISPDFCFDQLPDDPDHLSPILDNAMRRLPALQNVGLQTSFNGPESFTPDSRFLLGPSPTVENLFIATGFNSCGIESSGGAGTVLADWMTKGFPAADYWEIDPRRVMPFQRNQRYLENRTKETVGLLYAKHHPYNSPQSARGVRRSPIHEHLKRAGACFAEAAGWERPAWFGEPGSRMPSLYTFERGPWFDRVAIEHRATREAVTVFDQTSFAHLLVAGPGALELLQIVSTNDLDVPIGKVVYTPWLNERGGMESDVTIARVAETEFLVVTAGSQRIRDLGWLRTQKRINGSAAEIVDVSSGYATLSIMGPRSRDLMERLSCAKFDNDSFPFGTWQEIEIAHCTAMAFRMTFVGELGWELHVAVEFAADLYEHILDAGREFGLLPAEYLALESLRIEAGYRDWGHDVGDEDSPLEAGLGFTLAWSKPTRFLGRDILLSQKANVPKRRLIQVASLENRLIAYGTEPIFRGSTIVGYLKSAAFGHSLGRSVGMGYVSCDEGVSAPWLEAGNFEIEVQGERIPVRASIKSFYDPGKTRPKGEQKPLKKLIPVF